MKGSKLQIVLGLIMIGMFVTFVAMSARQEDWWGVVLNLFGIFLAGCFVGLNYGELKQSKSNTEGEGP